MPRAQATHNPELEHGEAGLMLLAVVVMCALILIGLSVAAPVMARQLRRDQEQESIRRMEQYDRAIRLYYKKNNSYPPSVEALENTNNVRYLRQKYIDPLTGKDDWRLIHVGQNQTQVSVFFGEPLAGIASSGLGSAASLGSGSTAGTTTTTPSTTIGQTSGLAAGFGGATIGGGTSTTAGTSSDSKSPLSGGGGPIMGVGTSRTGDSLATPNQQATYDTWEFLYDPRIEQLYKSAKLTGGGGGLGSQSASSFGKDAVSGQSNSSSGTATGTGSSSGTSGSGFGNSSR